MEHVKMQDDTFTIKIGEEDRKIKMTYGLLDQLCNTAGEVEDSMMFTLDKDLRAEALRLLLSERDKEGVIKKPVNMFTLDVDPEEVEALLDWAGVHVLDFFLRAMTKAKEHSESRKDLLSTLNGGEDSASQTQSA